MTSSTNRCHNLGLVGVFARAISSRFIIKISAMTADGVDFCYPVILLVMLVVIKKGCGRQAESEQFDDRFPISMLVRLSGVCRVLAQLTFAAS